MYDNSFKMNEDTRKWLNTVAVKLSSLYLNGFQSGTYLTEWAFAWDNSLQLEDNLANASAEDNALTTLTNMKVIKSTHKENFYKRQQEESFNDPLRGHIVWGGWHEFHPARREYDFLR